MCSVGRTKRRAQMVCPSSQRAAGAAALRHVSDADPGIRRVGKPGAFEYRDVRGNPVGDSRTLQRIRKLAIPPAYTDVWICASAHGHLQATGRDARGRKQYRYHLAWRAQRNDHKFGRLAAFGGALPRIRRQVQSDLAQPGTSRNTVLALVVALLDTTHQRIGNRAYARDNHSFGLTTLRDRHARTEGRELHLSFRGKSGRVQELRIDDQRLATLIRRCRELPGYQLFQYIDGHGRRRLIDSGMVNRYLQAVAGEAFSAKDFRTWAATLSTIRRLALLPSPDSQRGSAREASIQGVINQVAAELSNTPAVCRRAYIHPLVFDRWRNGMLQRLFRNGDCSGRPLERRALKLLAHDSTRRSNKAARKS